VPHEFIEEKFETGTINHFILSYRNSKKNLKKPNHKDKLLLAISFEIKL